LKKEKILLVEDDPDHAELIIDVLEEDNVKNIKTEVILKKDGQEAIDYFQYEMQSQVSLVILDLNLPKINGMDVLKFIKKNSKYCSIPVIILSTSSDHKTIDEVYENGANGYFIKPDSYKGLVEEVKILKKSLPRFGKIAVDIGFVTEKHLNKALAEQADDDLSNKPHRLIGSILLENGWINQEQLDIVLNEHFKKEKTNE
jgi:DNA-binding response OmpR family regulator